MCNFPSRYRGPCNKGSLRKKEVQGIWHPAESLAYTWCTHMHDLKKLALKVLNWFNTSQSKWQHAIGKLVERKLQSFQKMIIPNFSLFHTYWQIQYNPSLMLQPLVISDQDILILLLFKFFGSFIKEGLFLIKPQECHLTSWAESARMEFSVAPASFVGLSDVAEPAAGDTMASGAFCPVAAASGGLVAWPTPWGTVCPFWNTAEIYSWE